MRWVERHPQALFRDIWIIRPAPVIAALGDRIHPTRGLWHVRQWPRVHMHRARFPRRGRGPRNWRRARFRFGQGALSHFARAIVRIAVELTMPMATSGSPGSLQRSWRRRIGCARVTAAGSHRRAGSAQRRLHRHRAGSARLRWALKRRPAQVIGRLARWHSSGHRSPCGRVLCHDCDRVLAAIVWPLRERSGHGLDGARGVVRAAFGQRGPRATRPARPCCNLTKPELCRRARSPSRGLPL